MNKEMIAQFEGWYKSHESEIRNAYFDFLRFPSISTDSKFANEVKKCALWLGDYLKSTGFRVEFWETPGHPVIYADWLNAGGDKPTVLIYGHYDVQPVDPLDLWQSPPFEPTLRDGEVYARGAVDDKGQCFYAIAAASIFLRESGSLPINVKFLIEGEEEISSPNLPALLKEKSPELRADHLLIVDLQIPGMDRPAVTLGTRGITTWNVELTGSKSDLHSGTYGGMVYNPNHALVEILSKLRDRDGRVLIPGFYDDVDEPSDDELSELDLSFDTAQSERELNAKLTGGEKEFSPLESAWLRPTLEINGISGGYTGEGFKTVIPAKAFAKVSARLVPNQDPEKIGKAFTAHLESLRPEGIDLEIVQGAGAFATRTSIKSRVVQASADAFSSVFDKPCSFILEGASIPIVPQLAQAAQAEAALIGLGLPGDNMHAPNEHFGLERFRRGFLIACRILSLLGVE